MDTLDRCLPAAKHSQQGVRNTSSMDLDLEMKRKYLRDQIYQKLVQQRPQMTPDMQPKMKDIVKRLEECLFESAKEEYMNMDTLDQRLDTLIRRLPAANHSQQGLRNTSSMNLDLEMKSKYLRDQMCHDVEQIIEERERHPINSRDKHALYPVEVRDVAADTKDRDEILESEFFDTKHSSMMVLYHLHNPTAPAFVTTCNVCHDCVEIGQGWRCEICAGYDVCNACFHKDGGVDHPHNLTNHPSTADRDAQNKEGRQKGVAQLREMLDLMVHASQCRFPQCPYPKCRRVKGLFRHGQQCRTRASGGCILCKKMWYILQLHARYCKESECHVPRCRDLKEHLRRLQQQSLDGELQ